jgi:hypothetical protein
MRFHGAYLSGAIQGAWVNLFAIMLETSHGPTHYIVLVIAFRGYHYKG